MTETVARPVPTTNGFLALLLSTAGGFALAGTAMPVVGAAAPAALGVELVIWAFVARAAGLLIAGSTLAGVGTGVILAAGPLAGAGPQPIGAAFLFGVAAGFTLITTLSWLWWREPRAWAAITAVAVGAAGAATLTAGTGWAGAVNWAAPVALLIGGLVAGLRWRRGRRP
ncbi:hypothetical protein [Nakamurella sp.]|uniref:hypothetical protein n=1 Tax=Nakamurella sp. TaxID=1869182 RepID=UPI003784AA4F